MKKATAFFAMIGVTATTAYALHLEGRLWLCSCGTVRFWTGDIWSAENSQQLFDPYSFTHLLHGFIFCGLLAWLAPRTAFISRAVVALGFEALWEIAENTDAVIERYRGSTAAVGYHGDTVLNSLGDILCFAAGFVLARILGFRRSAAVFALVEALLLVWIRDGLILNVIMLIYPLEGIRAWQMGR